MMRNRQAGTSLVELLVVIVVFLIGILAILQIFPGGLRVLQNTRNMAMARQLGRARMETLVNQQDRLPEMILPVRYTFVGSGAVDISADLSRPPEFTGHPGDGITQAGIVTQGATQLGRWEYLVGANRMRRVIGEGGRVPAPRQVGTDFGGLMLLQFAPISYNPAFPTLLQIYGNDMVRREGQPGFRTRDWEYFLEEIEEPTAKIYVPRGRTRDRIYRLAFSAWVDSGGTVQRRSIVDTTLVVPFDVNGGWVSFDMAAYAALGPGETFVGAEWESVRLARAFEQVAVFSNGEPYEYKVLDARLGVLLFNPAGYNFQEVRPGRRLPLVAKANYDVFDWRIIQDEFRVPQGMPFQQRLSLPSLRVKGSTRSDATSYPGLDVPVLPGNGSNTPDTRDILLIDQETGGVYTEASFHTDKSAGVITFLDKDSNPVNGVQSDIVLPGATTSIEVNSSGRAAKALYQANGDWAVQVMKAPSLFTITYAAPGVAQYYVGGSSLAGGVPTRIYFPLIDVGRKVVVGEIWYRDSGGNLKSLMDQDFVISNTPNDPLGPYVDITTVDPTATGFDYSYGYAARRVKGASLAVRVLWNPETFFLIDDLAENDVRFNRWTQGWRRTTTETFLTRGDQ